MQSSLKWAWWLVTITGAATLLFGVWEIAISACSNPLPPALADISRGWRSGIVPFKFTGSLGGEDQKNAIRAAMAEWETKTGVVKFVEEPNNPAAWIINLDAADCTAGGMRLGCQLLHETGHLVGLAHEQQRQDAGRFITLIQNDDICNDLSEGTRYTDTIWSGTNYGPYNENSVMHYGPNPGKDSTYDFTRLDGTVNNLGSLGTIQPSDASSVQELQARFLNWDRFRSRGTTVGPGPLVTQLASGVFMQTGKEMAAARVRHVDLVAVFGTDGRVYMSSHGTQSSGWRPLFTSATAIAATAMGGQIAVARSAATGISVQVSTNAQTLVAANPDGGDAFNNGLVWSAAVNWGAPSGTTVAGFALASLGPSRLAAVARTTNGQLWTRHTTNLTTVSGSWTLITEGVVGRPAMAAFSGSLRIFHSQTSGGSTTLWQSICTINSCTPPANVGSVQAGTTATVSASETELHLVSKNPAGQLNWQRFDVNGSVELTGKLIGGLLAAEGTATNSFEDRFGSFALFAELGDHNLWQRVYNRYFQGRLSNLPPNDYDRDAKTDPVVVRNGTWWVLPSSGLPGAAFAIAHASDVLLPAADYDGKDNGKSDLHIYRRSTGMWEGLAIDRSQTATGQPFTLASFGRQPDVQFGRATDRPVPGDYDGDWIMDEAVFRPSTGTWLASLSGGGPDLVVQFGVATDRPVPGDYDGDGKTDPAVFRQFTQGSSWFVRPSGGGEDIERTFGSATDRPVPGDYDGDGRTDFAVFSPTTGEWRIRFQTGEPDAVIRFGTSTDRVTPGDFDGDGRTDVALFRPTNGKWYIHPSSGGPDIVRTWGQATDALPWPEHTHTPSTTGSDYDGDGKSDVTVFRPSSGTWFSHLSSGGPDQVTQFGISTDRMVPGDYDGDGRTDVAVFRTDANQNGTWFVHPSSGGPDRVVPLGIGSDKTVPGDYDGDGRVDPAVYRSSTGMWLARLSSGDPNFFIKFGMSTDIPVPGDYDGDGKTDPAVFRPTDGKWYIHPSASGPDIVIKFGVSTDRVIAADWDGDGRTDVAVFRVDANQNGTWFVRPSGGGSDLVIPFGVASDRLVSADYDGDHKTDVTVFRVDASENARWFTRPSLGLADTNTPFGVGSDIVADSR